MKNISFDNPYLLLLAIPLFLAVIIPFVIAIRKDNRSKSVFISLAVHLVIAALAVLAVSGTVHTTVMTKTEVYVVADVSYSSNRNLDEIDSCIESLKDSLPRNSELGVICFGKDCQLLTPMGEATVSVKNATVDASATNIAPALDYAASLFSENVIKRVVLISDGRDTAASTGTLISSVESLYAKDIYIDSIFIDNNLPENMTEVQISDVGFTESTYLNRKTTADLLIRSNTDGRAILSLYRGEEKAAENIAVSLTKGFNVVNIDLDTSAPGIYDYRAVIDMANDYSKHNNEFFFTQTVSSDIKVLLISSSPEDEEKISRLYGENAEIDGYLNTERVPFTLEKLCEYDEIILSDVDVRTLENYTAFVENLEKCVSIFGKSLITLGDTRIQNNTDDVLMDLNDMLPVNYGNKDQDPKLIALVIDTSRSMNDSYQLIMMKRAAIQMLELLSDNDYVAVVSFSGDVTVAQPPTLAKNRESVAEVIKSISATQGTFIGAGLREAYSLIKDLPYGHKEMMLISDGLSYSLEPDDPVSIAKDTYENGIKVSTVNTASPEGAVALKEIARAGGGSYYFLERVENVEDLVLGEIADDITETVIRENTVVLVNRGNDPVLSGISSMPNISGYVYSRAKASAVSVLTVSYKKSCGGTLLAPLYAYWDYGNGRVASFTSTLNGEWVSLWNNTVGDRFFTNMLKSSVPEEKTTLPFNLSVEYDGINSSIELLPINVDPFATTAVEVILPDGSKITKELIFDSERYFYSFETPMLGKYTLNVSYTASGTTYNSTSYFNLSYSPEYDSFTVFDSGSLHEIIRNRGTVNLDADFKIRNDGARVATYEINCTVPLLTVAVVLFVADVIIRKIKWADITTIFKKKSNQEAGK